MLLTLASPAMISVRPCFRGVSHAYMIARSNLHAIDGAPDLITGSASTLPSFAVVVLLGKVTMAHASGAGGAVRASSAERLE